MLKIRFARRGSKKRPFYQVVLANSRSPRDGLFLEALGFCNPFARGKEEPFNVNLPRIYHWINTGAQVSDRVASLIARAEAIGATETVVSS